MKYRVLIALTWISQLYASKTSSYVSKPLPEAPRKTVAARPLPPLPKIPKLSPAKLIEAITDDKDLVRQQLQAYPEQIEVVDAYNNNLLMLALETEMNDDDIIEDPNFMLELLEKTKNLEHRNKDGQTVLIKAARYPHEEILEALLKRGAQVNVVDKEGTTPLKAAVENKNREHILMLLHAGVPIDLTILLRTSPNIYPPELIAKIVKKVVEDMQPKKITIENIGPQWREVLGKLHPTLQKIFALDEQLKKETSAVYRAADAVIFIYVDHTEQHRGIVTRELIQAITTGRMIIIATTHLLLNGLRGMNPEFIAKYWDIRLADESGQIVVLLPYLEGGPALYGIKVDSLKRVSIDELKEIHKKHELGQYPDQYLVPALPKIFVTRKEYPQRGEIDHMPRYAFYIDGHGQLGTDLSGLSIDHFQRLLKFLETQVRTVFFAYTSCFALGTNTERLFQDVRSILKGTTYSFPIATNGKIDDVTYSGLQHVDYWSVVSLLTQGDTIDLTKILPALFGDIRAIQPAFVRFPGVSWFVPFDAVTKSISIGSSLVAGRTEPLRVQDQLLLLYENVIPFELKIISPDKSPHFLSMLPGEAIHYFSAIDIGPNDFIKFIQHMISNLPRRRIIFWIKRLSSSKQQNGIFQGTQLLEDVIFEFSPAPDGTSFIPHVHLKKNNVPYRLEGGRLVEKADYRPSFEKFFLNSVGQSLEERLKEIANTQQRAQDITRALQQRKAKVERGESPKTVVGLRKPVTKRKPALS